MCIDYIHETLWRRHLAEVAHHARLARLFRSDAVAPEATGLIDRLTRFLRHRPRHTSPLVPHLGSRS